MNFNVKDLPSQEGKIAVITGANSGIGYETALVFARTGIRVVMACRNQEKAEKARDSIKMSVPGADLDIMLLDLASFASVREFAAIFSQKYRHLDLLINNAGIMWVPFSRTTDGFESTFAVNYLGHFLLTSRLLDLMPDDEASRVVCLSSLAHKTAIGKLTTGRITSQEYYCRINAYSWSKLACLLFSQELHRRLEQSRRKVLSVAAHPGFALDTGLFEGTGIKHTIRYLANFLSNSAENGALPSILAALAPGVKGGDYWGPTGFAGLKGKPGIVSGSRFSREEKPARLLWDLSEKLVQTRFTI